MIEQDLERLSYERELSHVRTLEALVATIRSAIDEDGSVIRRLEITLKSGQKLTCVPPSRRTFRTYEPDSNASYKVRVDDTIVLVTRTEQHRAADERIETTFPVEQIALVEVTSRIDDDQTE